MSRATSLSVRHGPSAATSRAADNVMANASSALVLMARQKPKSIDFADSLVTGTALLVRFGLAWPGRAARARSAPPCTARGTDDAAGAALSGAGAASASPLVSAVASSTAERAGVTSAGVTSRAPGTVAAGAVGEWYPMPKSTSAVARGAVRPTVHFFLRQGCRKNSEIDI